MRITFGELNASHHEHVVLIEDGTKTYTGKITTIAHYLDQGVTGVSLDTRAIAIQRRHAWPITVLNPAP
ncbi:hypothetical protein SCB71_14485 [Herbiconiux sp. KACC 21604]|uniref:hypothetical protein n=1 Tax=unclassified Herbiconiux TaxID=2618217 RepID=UPI0014929B0A|nr:hypothetical protein [Herbiconiux sp. SALV-R1]QJU54350.1 hypothetical protein HL652_12425 [Herbiconiux sp. SALV-R1]WPO85420.1 hypothetical protein SCB71_14485 [Herbiconiux sp. KACC 21604]